MIITKGRNTHIDNREIHVPPSKAGAINVSGQKPINGGAKE